MAQLEKDVELLETAIEDIEEELEEIVEFIEMTAEREGEGEAEGEGEHDSTTKLEKAKAQLGDLLDLIRNLKKEGKESSSSSSSSSNNSNKGKKSRISMLEDIDRLTDELNAVQEEKEMVEEKMYEQGIKIRRLLEENKDLKNNNNLIKGSSGSSSLSSKGSGKISDLLESGSESESDVSKDSKRGGGLTTDDEDEDDSSESDEDTPTSSAGSKKKNNKQKLTPSQRINNILSKESSTLDDLFSKEDLHEELTARYGARDTALISFFCKPNIVNALIDTVVNIPPVPPPTGNSEEDKEIPPVPYTASEILTSGIQPLTDNLCQAATLQRFFSLLDRPPPLPGNSPIASLWYKVMSHLLQVKSMELSMYIKENSVLPKVVNHINSECVLNLLLTMLNTEAKLETYGDEFQWSHLNLVELLGAKLDSCAITEATVYEWPNITHHTTALDNISEFLCEILTKYPFSSPLVLQMQEIPFVKRLVRNCFVVYTNELENGTTPDEEPNILYASRLRGPTHCLQILVHILALSVNGGSYAEIEMPPVLTELLCDGSPVENIPSPLNSIAAILQAFVQDVQNTEDLNLKEHANLKGKFLLGEYRLRVLMVAVGLARTGYFWADHGLLKAGILQSLFYIFFNFPWNNVIHSMVTEFIISLLPPQSPPSRATFSLVLLKDLKFFDNIVVIAEKIGHTGIVGHIANLITAIHRAAASTPVISEYLQEHNDWPNLVQKMTALTEVSWQNT